MIQTQSDSHGVKLSVTNSKIQHSAVWGLYFNKAATVTQSGNSFADNTLGDTFTEP